MTPKSPIEAHPPTLSQRLLRALGREMYEAGRPIADCLTKDERIGWLAAQAAATNNTNGK